MKTYQEMIQFLVDKADERVLGYHEPVACTVVAEIYNILPKTVFADVNHEIVRRENAHKAAVAERHSGK